MTKILIDEATVKLVLEALEHCKDVIVERGLNGNPEFAERWGLTLPLDRSKEAITALKALAAQPAQQEPVISTAHGPWIPSTHPGEEGESYCKRCLLRDKFLGSRQCDPHIVPPEQPAHGCDHCSHAMYAGTKRKHCGRVTEQPAQQESVGYVAENGVVDWNICAPPIMTDLYTSPPQRKPLTDEEIGKAWSVADGEHNASASVKRRITRAIEAAHGIKENT